MADPLSVAASVVGVAVPALRGTRLLLDDLQKLNDALKTIMRLKEDVHSIELAFTTLQTVEDREWQSLGTSIAEESKTTVSTCREACDQSRANLRHWTRHSENGKLVLKDRANVGFFKQGQITEMSEQLQNCKLTINSIDSIATLYSSIRHTHITEEIKRRISMKQTEIEGAVNKTDEQLIVLENKFKEFHLSNNGQDAAESTESIGSKAEVLQQLEEERKVPSVSQKVLDELLSKSKEEAIAKAAAENQRHSATVTFGNQNSGFQAGSINGPVSGITFGGKNAVDTAADLTKDFAQAYHILTLPRRNVSQTQKAFPVKRGTSTANGFPIGLCAFSNSHLVTTPPQTAIHLSQGTDDLVVAAPSQDIKEGQNYGVKVLHNGGSGACVDIVFVHGLTGKAYNTWLHKETGIHWPSELLRQDIPKSRILSFGYDADVVHIFRGGPASNSRLSNHAESLVGKLVRARERSETETRKIIFVARSLGGLVTEQALARSKNSAEQHLHQVELHTIGIVFLEVPHSGTDLEAWATVGRRMASILKRTNKDILGVLNPDSEMLHMVENNFHTNLRQRKDDPIEIVGFYEELPVKGIGEIVPQHSAKIAGYNFYGIHADHTDMMKFPSREDPGYDAILGELQRWIKGIRRAKQYTSLSV